MALSKHLTAFYVFFSVIVISSQLLTCPRANISISLTWMAPGNIMPARYEGTHVDKCFVLYCSNADFFTIVELPEGEHQYKFYVDGNWLHNVNEVGMESFNV